MVLGILAAVDPGERILILIPIFGIVAVIIGSRKKDAGWIAAGVGMIVIPILRYLIHSDEVRDISDFAMPLYLKIGIGILCSLIAGVIIRLLFRKWDE